MTHNPNKYAVSFKYDECIVINFQSYINNIQGIQKFWINSAEYLNSYCEGQTSVCQEIHFLNPLWPLKKKKTNQLWGEAGDMILKCYKCLATNLKKKKWRKIGMTQIQIASTAFSCVLCSSIHETVMKHFCFRKLYTDGYQECCPMAATFLKCCHKRLWWIS